MKLLILAAVFFLVTADEKYKVRDDIAEQWEKTIESQKEECLKESGQKEEDVRDLYKKGHYPKTPEFKRYVKCLCVKLNFVGEDGIIDEERIRNTVKAADLDIVEECLAAVKDEKDINEKTYLFSILLIEKVSKRYPPQH